MINQGDKYTAVWVSYSSMSDFLACRRSYFLKHVFKNPKTKRKISIASPYLTLGVVVHNVVESLKKIKTEDRKSEIENNFISNFKEEWQKFAGKRGGFSNEEQEKEFFDRGINMIQKIIQDPKILLNKIIPDSYFYKGDMLPNYFLSQEENIILCGNIDWIEYLENDNAMRIVDFKTSRNDEKEDSFQLPIYYLLIDRLDEKKKYKIKDIAYWYLDQDNKKSGNSHDEFHITNIDEQKLKEIYEIEKKILNIGIDMKKAKLQNKSYEDWSCNNEKVKGEGCKSCKDISLVYKYIMDQNSETSTIYLDESEMKSVEYVGLDNYGKDLYFIKD